jgi:hypothetical protein
MACFSDPTLQLIIVIVLPSACRHNTVVLTSARPHHSRNLFPRTDEVIKRNGFAVGQLGGAKRKFAKTTKSAMRRPRKSEKSAEVIFRSMPL